MSDDIERFDAIVTFAQAALDAGQVWGLEHAEGLALAGSEENPDQMVMPFWTSEEAARRCASDEWADYKVSAIPLDSFLEQWLPGMHEDGYMVGLNWNADMEGIEVEPQELAETLEDLMDEEEDREEEN